jgi:adenine-specific DNA methylase
MPRRLIEEAFPLQKVSEDSKHEKNVRHGHISTLHIWPARRPLAACRATIFATLLPDPGEPDVIPDDGPGPWMSAALRKEYENLAEGSKDPAAQRAGLCKLIEGFTRWKSESGPNVATARTLIRLAYGGKAPRVLDPFAGGGAIPLEAMRLGCEAIAMDVNPVAWLILKCTLDYPQRFAGKTWPLPPDPETKEAAAPASAPAPSSAPPVAAGTQLGLLESDHVKKGTQLALFTGGTRKSEPKLGDLAAHVRYWGNWVLKHARKELALHYPRVQNQEAVAYVWARTVPCPDPRCGTTVPLVKTLWLCQKKGKLRALKVVPNSERKRVDFEVYTPAKEADVGEGTMGTGARVSCPGCRIAIPPEYVRAHGSGPGFGLQLLTVISGSDDGKSYSDPSDEDRSAAEKASALLRAAGESIPWGLPDEAMNERELLCSRSTGGTAFVNLLFGLNTWSKLFTPRQLVTLASVLQLARAARSEMMARAGYSAEQSDAVAAYLAMVHSRLADRGSSLCVWQPSAEKIGHTFARFALPMTWDFCESAPLADSSGGLGQAVEWVVKVVGHLTQAAANGTSEVLLGDVRTATGRSLLSAVVTDPPYYDAVPYADLSDFFYVWLRRGIGDRHPDVFADTLVPKRTELVQHAGRAGGDDAAAKRAYEAGMAEAFRRFAGGLDDDGRAVVVFAHKDPDAWETLVSALIAAGMTVSASWPIDTERASRSRGIGSAALATSLWMVCRKRAAGTGVGRYKAVLKAMRDRMTERLQYFWNAGISGPDFVWAAVGPALEAYSSHTEVKRLDGSPYTVGEFLRDVRRHVTDFALSRILGGATTEGLDPWTAYYLMHRQSFGMEDAPVGECILYAQGYGLDADALRGDRGVLTKGKKGADLRLLRAEERTRDSLGEPHPAGGLPMIDQLHRLLRHWNAGDVSGLNDYVARHGLRDSGLFWTVAQAIVEMAEAGSAERAQLESVVAMVRGRRGEIGQLL